MADNNDTIELRVSKAIPSDVGFGRARISSEMAVSYTHLTLPTILLV